MKTPENNDISAYPLPLVSEQTLDTALADLEEEGYQEYLRNSLTNLFENNPGVSGVIQNFIGEISTTSEEEAIALQAVAFMHELLKKQAAADQLEKSINGS